MKRIGLCLLAFAMLSALICACAAPNRDGAAATKAPEQSSTTGEPEEMRTHDSSEEATAAPTLAPTASPASEPTATPEPTAALDSVVAFADPTFEAVFREKYGFGDEPIYVADILEFKELDLEKQNLRNISDLAMFTNLTSLSLNRNYYITDISAISNLTGLTELNLSYIHINNTSALSNLTDLIELDLSYNNITDIGGLSNLTNLTKLSLEYNRISDLSALSNLTNLTDLYL